MHPSYEGKVPGRVSGRSSLEGWVDILTGDGVIRLLEVIDSSRQNIAAGFTHKVNAGHAGTVNAGASRSHLRA